MKKVSCPFCAYDVAVVGEGSVENATARVLQHAREKHPEAPIKAPEPGVFEGVAANKAIPLESKRNNVFTNLTLSVSTTEENRDIAYSVLGTTGHDLLRGGFDFSISANEIDMDVPPFEPSYKETGEHLYYDGMTIIKVRSAIRKGLRFHIPIEVMTDQIVDDVINELQNADILFRERS